MNPYMIKYFETTIEPRICRMWEMSSVYPNYPQSNIKTNTNPQMLGFNTEYSLSATFGKKYVSTPELYFNQYNQLVKKYSLDDFVDMMNFNGDMETYKDENGRFTFTACEDYGLMQGNIYNNIAKYTTGYSNLTNIDGFYAFTNLRYVNIKSTRNALACLDNIDCIVNYCHNNGIKWMYDANTQLCYYPVDAKLAESDEKMFFTT